MSTDATPRTPRETHRDVSAPEPLAPRLDAVERCVSGGVSLVLLVAALAVAILPVDRRVVLPACTGRGQECVVAVDADLAALATALIAAAAIAALIAVLGVRFGTLKGPGFELGGGGWNVQASGLPRKEKQQPEDDVVLSQDSTKPEPEPEPEPVAAGDVPLAVEIETPGTTLGVAPIAVTRLTAPMSQIDPRVLRDFQSGRRAGQRSHFLAHVLGPPTTRGQEYSVAIKVVPHRSATEEIRSASFFLGRSWGNRVFRADRGKDGRFGIVTEAYGPFLALCEVEFDDGTRLLLDHYCDFESGPPRQ